jgi:hypothetical protein
LSGFIPLFDRLLFAAGPALQRGRVSAIAIVSPLRDRRQILPPHWYLD